MDISPAAEHGHPKMHAVRGNAQGKAHGVVAKLGTGHFNPVAEARLSALFAHRLEQPEKPDGENKPQPDSIDPNDSADHVPDTTDPIPELSPESQQFSNQMNLEPVRLSSPLQSLAPDATRIYVDLTA